MSQVIEVDSLVKRFGETRAVDGISFSVQAGESVAMLGPNGAGKTTTLEMLEGLQEPTSGTVRLFGKRWSEARAELCQRIGVQLQGAAFPALSTVEEVLTLFRSLYPRGASVEEMIQKMRLAPKRRTLAHHLSMGQRQRLSLALAMMAEPDVIFLDEPSTGLDPQSRRELWDLILELHREGRTIFLTTHYMDEAAALCGRILIIDSGKLIADGTPGGLIEKLGGAQRIELATRPPLDLRWETLPAVLAVQTSPAGEVVLEVSRVSETLSTIVSAASAANVQIDRLSVKTPTLDDVFLRVTGRQLNR